MDVLQEIVRKVDKLPPDAQERVLRFAASLSTAEPVGEPGVNFLPFAGTIDAESLREMEEAIEEECERIDASEW